MTTSSPGGSVGSGPAITEPDPAALADAAGSCPAVAGMHEGPAASYLPGRRVAGVQVEDGSVHLHVDLAYPATVVELSQQVRAAVAGLLGGRVLEITVEDVVLPADLLPGAADEPDATGASDAASSGEGAAPAAADPAAGPPSPGSGAPASTAGPVVPGPAAAGPAVLTGTAVVPGTALGPDAVTPPGAAVPPASAVVRGSVPKGSDS